MKILEKGRNCVICDIAIHFVDTFGGGTSRKRMHAAKDYSGAEIMRTLLDEVLGLS